MPSSALDLLNQYDTVQSVANEIGVRPELVHAVIRQESGGRADARSPKGAMGLMQVMPSTAANPGYGMQPFDASNPDENLRGGVTYLKKLIDHYGGDESKALAAYNAGQGNVDSGKASTFPETQHYVANISKHAGAPAAASAAPKSAVDLLNSYDEQQTAAPQAPSFLDNVVSSGKNFVQGVGETLAHPITTAENLGKTAVGAAQLGLPDSARQAMDFTPYAQAVGKFYKNRYGSLDAIKNTLYTDPVGAAADAAGLLSGTGELLDGANVLAKSSTLGKVADVAKAAGSLVDPLKVPGKVLNTVVQRPAEAMAERIVMSNMKVPKTLKKQNMTVNIPRTILDEGLAKGNFKKAADLAATRVEQLSGDVSKLTDADTAKGNLHSLQPILDNLDRLEAEYQHQPAAAQDLAAVRAARQQLLDNPLYTKPATPSVTKQVPVAVDARGNYIMGPQTTPGSPATLIDQSASEIDRMKKNVYAGLKGKYGKEQSAVIESDKASGRALKGILDDNVPGVGAINDRQRKVIVARNALQDAALREQNKLPLGIMDMIGAGALGVGALAHNPLMAAITGVPTVTALALKHPTTAMPIARVLHGIGTAHLPSLPGSAVIDALSPTRGTSGKTQLNEAVTDVGKRKISGTQARSAYEAYLAAQTAAQEQQ